MKYIKNKTAFLRRGEFAVNLICFIVIICVAALGAFNCGSSLAGYADSNESALKKDTQPEQFSNVEESPVDGETASSSENGEIASEYGASLTFVRTTADVLKVRSAASSVSAVLGFFESGDMCLYAEKYGDWFKIYYAGGYAYVNALYSEIVSISYQNQTVADVIAAGARMIGAPYVYGAARMLDSDGNLLNGFDDGEFDCSSFTQYAFYVGANIKIDVTTRTQIYEGETVDEIAPGDLMFFTNAARLYNTGIERIGHVGIYIGDNYILHTSSDYAVIECISDLRWSYFIQANRLICD